MYLDKRRIYRMAGLGALTLALMLSAVVPLAYAANYYGTLVVTKLGLGNGGNAYLTATGYGCDATSDSAAGPWSALTGTAQGVRGTSSTFTVVGAAIGDQCNLILGAAAAGSGQSVTLTQTCVVTASNIATEYIRTPTSVTRGSITPRTGQRCALTMRATN